MYKYFHLIYVLHRYHSVFRNGGGLPSVHKVKIERAIMRINITSNEGLQNRPLTAVNVFMRSECDGEQNGVFQGSAKTANVMGSYLSSSLAISSLLTLSLTL